MGLPVGTYQLASATYVDAGGERGNMRVYGKVITAANEVAQAAAWATLLGAIDDLSLGARSRDTYNDTTTYDWERPINGAARELALRATFHDTVNGQRWTSIVVPCVNGALVEFVSNENAKDVVDLTTTEVAALIAALEAFPVVNPYAQANAVEVVDIVEVRGQK